MSEYPGQDPATGPEMRPPYGTYGQAPYDVTPAQMYPPGYAPPGYPPAGYAYGYHPDPGARSGAIAALVTGCIAIVVCVGLLAVPTAILGGVALSRADTDPASARNLTKWAWICLGIGAGLMVLFAVAYVGFMFWAMDQATGDAY